MLGGASRQGWFQQRKVSTEERSFTAADLVFMEGDFDVLNNGSTLLARKVLCGLENVAVQQGHLESVGHAKCPIRTPVG